MIRFAVVLSALVLGTGSIACGTSTTEASSESALEATGASAELTAFDALDDAAKVEHAYNVTASPRWATHRPEFALKDVRIVDTFEGETEAKALAAYFEMREIASAQGGTVTVSAVERDGETYVYQIWASGRTYGDWAECRIFTRDFTEIGAYSYAE